MLSSQNQGFVIHLTPYAGNYFNVIIGAEKDPDYAMIEDLVEGSSPTKDKLASLITLALSKLSNEELLKLFSLYVRALEHADKQIAKLKAEITRLQNKLNKDSQNFEIECLRAEVKRLRDKLQELNAADALF